MDLYIMLENASKQEALHAERFQLASRFLPSRASLLCGDKIACHLLIKLLISRKCVFFIENIMSDPQLDVAVHTLATEIFALFKKK